MRVVQDKLVTPLGATTPEKVDFRLVCATHRDLREMVASGTFREDLYMRLAEKTVYLPPLRSRREEIAHLVALSLAGTGLRAKAQVMETLMLQAWPGNVRDLMRALKEAKLSAEGERVLTVQHLPEWARVGAAPPAPVEGDSAPSKKERREALKRYYAQYRNATKAGELAGVARETARRWLREDGLLAGDE